MGGGTRLVERGKAIVAKQKEGATLKEAEKATRPSAPVVSAPKASAPSVLPSPAPTVAPKVEPIVSSPVEVLVSKIIGEPTEDEKKIAEIKATTSPISPPQISNVSDVIKIGSASYPKSPTAQFVMELTGTLPQKPIAQAIKEEQASKVPTFQEYDNQMPVKQFKQYIRSEINESKEREQDIVQNKQQVDISKNTFYRMSSGAVLPGIFVKALVDKNTKEQIANEQRYRKQLQNSLDATSGLSKNYTVSSTVGGFKINEPSAQQRIQGRIDELGKQDFGIFKQAAYVVSQSALSAFDPNMYISVAKGEGAKYYAGKQERTIEQIRNKQYLEAWAEPQLPAYENVIIPLATRGMFKYISAGAKVARAGSFTEKAYKYFVNPTGKIIGYGVVPAMVGTEVGMTAAKTGIASPETIGTIGTTMWQFGLVGVGYSSKGKISVSKNADIQLAKIQSDIYFGKQSKLQNIKDAFGKMKYNIQRELSADRILTIDKKPEYMKTYKSELYPEYGQYDKIKAPIGRGAIQGNIAPETPFLIQKTLEYRIPFADIKATAMRDIRIIDKNYLRYKIEVKYQKRINLYDEAYLRDVESMDYQPTRYDDIGKMEVARGKYEYEISIGKNKVDIGNDRIKMKKFDYGNKEKQIDFKSNKGTRTSTLEYEKEIKYPGDEFHMRIEDLYLPRTRMPTIRELWEMESGIGKSRFWDKNKFDFYENVSSAKSSNVIINALRQRDKELYDKKIRYDIGKIDVGRLGEVSNIRYNQINEIENITDLTKDEKRGLGIIDIPIQDSIQRQEQIQDQLQIQEQKQLQKTILRPITINELITIPYRNIPPDTPPPPKKTRPPPPPIRYPRHEDSDQRKENLQHFILYGGYYRESKRNTGSLIKSLGFDVMKQQMKLFKRFGM